MPNNKISSEQVLEANKEAFIHDTLHNFKVLVETRGLHVVMDRMDNETYWKLDQFFR